jgi:hypothetical protein
MKDVLVKCRVFKVKDKKAAQVIEVDKLAIELEDGNNGKTVANAKSKGMVATK